MKIGSIVRRHPTKPSYCREPHAVYRVVDLEQLSENSDVLVSILRIDKPTKWPYKFAVSYLIELPPDEAEVWIERSKRRPDEWEEYVMVNRLHAFEPLNGSRFHSDVLVAVPAGTDRAELAEWLDTMVRPRLARGVSLYIEG